MSLWKPYLLKVFFSNKYVYASILHKAHPKDEGRFVAAANTLQRSVQAALTSPSAQQGTQHDVDGQQPQELPVLQEQQQRAPRVSRSDCHASRAVGQALAQKAKALHLDSVHFQRGRKQQYQGKLRALIEAMRESGVGVQ